MSAGLLEQLLGFFKLEVRFSLLMATDAYGLIHQGTAKRIGDRSHGPMTLSARNTLRKMNVSLAVGF